MRSSATARSSVCAVVVAAALLALPGAAHAGEFSVAACQAASLNFTTEAFEDFATRGMNIKRACDPEGPGLRGLVTANVVRRGNVARGSVAMVAINAPAGTRFTTFRWGGTARRRDCAYALQLYAEVPGGSSVPIKNVRANKSCPRSGRYQAAGYKTRTYKVEGATRIVQRVVCVGARGGKPCSASGDNYVRTYKAEVKIADVLAPTVGIPADSALARGEWVSATQPLNYEATDNVGVRSAQAVVGAQTGGSQQRECAYASPAGAYAAGVPCPNGIGQIAVDTKRLPEGTQQLAVQAQDAAGNLATSAPVSARLDNTPPATADVAVEAGDGWRNTNDFAATWTNAPEPDRAPIAGATYKVCPAGGGSCTEANQDGPDLARVAVQVPAPGEWTLSLWRRDAAGNASNATASVPVTLRYDPDPPQLGFEAPAAADPTLVSVPVTDPVSGLSEGAIEISQSGTDVWQTLPTQKDGSRLVARIDDTTLTPGQYVLRARARDQAGNESSTTQRLDGQPMTVTLPIRIPTSMKAGVVGTKIVRRVVRRNGRRHVVRRRVKVLKPSGTVALGKRAQLSGQLVNTDGQGIGGAEVQVFSRTAGGEQLAAVVTTDSKGVYGYTATGTTNRVLRFAYAGSPLILPVQREVELRVPGLTSLRVSRKSVLNGDSVTFSGGLKTLPAAPGGKLVALQVRLSGRWQTFRTTRTDANGRWTVRYQFKRTRGVQRFRFRAELPPEEGYPFATGGSRSLEVRVRGR